MSVACAALEQALQEAETLPDNTQEEAKPAEMCPHEWIDIVAAKDKAAELEGGVHVYVCVLGVAFLQSIVISISSQWESWSS